MAASSVSFSTPPRPLAFTLYKWPPFVSHEAKTIRSPSGDQVGCASVKSFLVKRFGMPSGKSITYNRLRAVKASLLPSGDGTPSRIWVTNASGVSSIGYLNASCGPNSIFTSTSKGISVAVLDAMFMV